MIIVSIVIRFVVKVRRKYQANCAGREVIHLSPDHGADIKSEIRAVEVESLLAATIVEYDVKSSGDSNYQLVESLVRVAASLSTSRDIIKIVGALDFKRNVIASFHEGEIAPGIGDFRQVDDAAGI